MKRAVRVRRVRGGLTMYSAWWSRGGSAARARSASSYASLCVSSAAIRDSCRRRVAAASLPSPSPSALPSSSATSAALSGEPGRERALDLGERDGSGTPVMSVSLTNAP